MGQYRDKVELQKQILKAEEYKDTPKWLHTHRLTSMWYETEFTQKEVEVNGSVTDTEYNNGIVTRYRDGKLVHTFGEQKTGQELLDSYIRHS